MTEIIEIAVTVVRLLLALIILGLLPGYSLVYYLFPQGLDRLERFFLSAVSSVALSGLTAFFWGRTAVGLTPFYLVLTVLLVTAVFAFAYFRQSGRLAVIFSRLAVYTMDHLKKNLSENRAFILGYSRFILAGFLGLFLFVSLAERERPLNMVEFYISPEHLLLDRVAYQLDQNTMQVSVGIHNITSQPAHYEIVSRVNGEAADSGSAYSLTLAAGETWSGPIEVYFADTGQVEFVDLDLFQGLEPDPVGTLRIWISQDQ